MKMSKKLLSLFLALVMVITSCSVGFTAFAADNNKTDSNNDYWNGQADSEAAFDALNLLVDQFTPQIFNAVGNIKIQGKTISEMTGVDFANVKSLKSFVGDMSPVLMGVLGDSADKSQAIPGYNNSPQLYDYYYSYLDDETPGAVSFFTVYDICKANKKDSMEDAKTDLEKYATKNFPKLEALLGKYNAALVKYGAKMDSAAEGTALMAKYGEYINAITDPSKEGLRNITINGVRFGDCDKPEMKDGKVVVDGKVDPEKDDIQFLIDYINEMFAALGSPERVESAADLIYYMMMDDGILILTMSRFLGTALMGGAEIKIDGTTLTWDNYSTFTVQQIMNALFPTGDYSYSANSPYYDEMCLGFMVYTGAFGDLEAVKKAVNDTKITDEQFSTFCSHLKDDLHLTGYDKDAIVNYLTTESPFSEDATKYLLGYINDSQSSNLISGFFELCISDPGAAKAYVLHDNDYNSVYLFKNGKDGNALGIIDRLNAVMSSEALINKFGDALKDKANGQRDIVEPGLYTEDFGNFITCVQPFIDGKYKYEDFKIDDSLIVDVVNTMLNAKLAEFLDPNSEAGGFVVPIINGLLETGIDPYTTLKDVWKKLYENPVEEIFVLLPTLTIVLDELLVPLLFNKPSDDPTKPELKDKYNGVLYKLLCTGDGILAGMTQEAGNTDIGLGALTIDLNKALPSILGWLTAKTDEERAAAVAEVGFYTAPYDTNIPRFTNIYVADKAIGGFSLLALSDILAQNKSFQGDNAYLADVVEEAVIEIATFAYDAVKDYLAQHRNDTRYDSEGSPTQNGLNNVFVALPELLDIIGNKYIEKYNVDSNWTYLYAGKIGTVDKAGKTQKVNETLKTFKDLAANGTGPQVLEEFVNILIGNWVNGLLDILNDTIKDENNKITAAFPIVQGLLNDALGGLGEKSLITDVLDGLFQLKREDEASFTLSEQETTNFVGFKNASGLFLLANIIFPKGNSVHGILPLIKDLTDEDTKHPANYNVMSAFKRSYAKLENSSKVNKSAAGTDYDKLLSEENLKAADKLVNVLDTLLSSLLNNTTVNGFTINSNDGLLSGVATVATAYLGAKNVDDIAKLFNNYLYYITGESHGTKSTEGKIGTQPKNGKVDESKVYTPENLSNLVIQTYSLLENIIDYLFYNSKSGAFKDNDANMLLADAVYGIISPDAVAVRLEGDKYEKTREVLMDNSTKDRKLNWNSFKVEIAEANWSTGSYTKDYLKFKDSFSGKSNKEAFYDGLGDSLSGVAAIIGTLLTKSYTDSSRTTNYYSALVNPLLTSIANATGATGVMAPEEFNNATASQQLIKGIITPVSNILSQIYDAPASFLLNLVKGVAGLLDDETVVKLGYGALAPIMNLVVNASVFLGSTSKLSPTLAAKLPELALKLGQDILKKIFGEGGASSMPTKDIVVSLINSIKIGSRQLKDYVTLPSINWKKLATAKSPSEGLLLVYAYAVDTVLNSELISGLVDSMSPGLTKMLKQLSAVQILNILNQIIANVQSPTEIFWTFREYAGKITNTFVYPQGILASDATKAVGQLDDLVANVFPLLNGLGVTDIEGLSALVNDKLYTNDLLTKAAKGIYGALSTGTAGTIFQALGMDMTPQGIANYLTDKSYGKTYTSAAKKLRKAKSWDKVSTLNWGFKDGSAKAEKGFINGISAVLRPFNDILAVFLAEGNLGDKLDLIKAAKSLNLSGKTNVGSGDYTGTLDYTLKNGILTLGVRSKVKNYENKGNPRSIIKVDLVKIATELTNALKADNKTLSLGTNGYENAVIPILEAFMCKGVKTYKQYKKDYKKAKDNLLIDILTPVIGLVGDITDAPFDTVTKILPNVAYFIDSNGVAQAVGNLLSPITSKNGVLGVLSKNGLNIDKFIKLVFDKDLGKIVADLLGIKKKLTINLTDMSKTNIQVIVVPLVNSILQKNDINITIPDIDFKKLASHGTIKVVKSAARNDKGKFTTRQVKSRQGETLVAVLRYVSNLLIKNASGLSDIICGIDAVKKNDTIKNIVQCVFTQIGLAKQDDIVRAVFYFLTEQATDKFFDYSDFKFDDSYEFSWGDMDEEFCRKLAPMLDGMIGSLLEGGLAGLVQEKLYTDDLVAKLATGLYGAVEGVNINDNIGSLTNLLAMTDIDFSTGNVAKLLVDGDYGKTYPDAASIIKRAGSWKNVKAENLKFGVKDRDSFLNAITAVLRPIFGVLDVILNDASLNLFDLVKIPGSDGYSSTIVPLLEAFGVYNIKTQYQYREDCYKAYDNVLLDILNPLWDKVEDILNAPLQTVMSILPNLSLFFANDGLLQIVDNLLTPVTALLDAIRPIVDINDVLDAAGLDVPKLLKDKVGLNVKKFDLYDLPGTLKPLVGADNVVGTINSILGIIKIKGNALGLELPDIDWFKLASHGEFVFDGTSQAATYGKRIYVIADEDETLIALLRFLINTINYKDNYNQIVGLITGLLGDNVDESLAGTINDVLGMLKGDADQVISDLVDLLQQIAG